MKKALALLLAAAIALSVAACSSEKKDDKKTESTTAQSDTQQASKNDYVMSDDVKEGSVIDGVMTDISGSDPILTHTNASWLDTCVLYEVNIRQFTEEGTFKAFEDHLDRLKDMGVNTLWFMPIHPISETERKGTLGSYYAVADYMDVNPEFGTKDDFSRLVDKAHDMGFKVILDWVANHTGRDNAWIKEHEDWYVKGDDGKIKSPYDWTDTAQLNYDNYEMRAEMIKCMQYWIEDMDVDGFRCDHAIGVPAGFWNAAVYKLKSINSEIMMLAESSAAPTLTGYAFDSCYNDNFYGQALMVKGGIGTDSVQEAMKPGPRYEQGSFPMNYLDNHDKNSYEGSVVERFGDTYVPMLAVSYLAPGIPLIYTGNEEGYDHEIAFFEKDTVKWDSEPKYAPLITALSKLKAQNKALSSTNADIAFITTNDSNVTAFTRTDGDNTVIFVGNLYFDALGDITADIGAENVTCVMHYDGKTLTTDEVKMTKADFAKRDYQAYEYYVLIAD